MIGGDGQPAADRGVVRRERIPRGLRHRRHRGLVQDVIHALHGTTADLQPRHAAADESNAVAHGAEVLASAGGQVVQHNDVGALLHEALDEM